jgi:predicted Zn-dependent protease
LESVALRSLIAIVVTVAAPIVGGGVGGPTGGLAAAGAALVGWLWLWLWLPRAAHRAFRAGDVAVAARRYAILGRLGLGRRRRREAWLSRAASELASDDPVVVARGVARLGEAPPPGLDAVEEAVWLGNRAYALLRQGGAPAAALEVIDRALAVRPDVAALQHTRGQALLAAGRVDEAIAVLEGVRELGGPGGELGAALERARCGDLATAWAAKGEAAYAADYYARAARSG